MERYTSDTGSSAGKATSQPLQCNAKLVQTRRLHCIVLTPTKQPFDIHCKLAIPEWRPPP